MKSEGSGQLSIHISADYAIIETVFRTIVSVNQLSIYGATAYLCEEFGNPLISSKKNCAVMKQSESMVKSADLLNIRRPLQTDEQAQGDLFYNHKEKCKIFRVKKQLITLCTDAGFVKTVAPDKTL